jgi:hypothetical protein
VFAGVPSGLVSAVELPPPPQEAMTDSAIAPAAIRVKRRREDFNLDFL